MLRAIRKPAHSNAREHGDAEGAAREARLFARYLLGIEPTSELIERYRRADAILFPEAATGADAALLDYVLRRPASLPLLDCAAGWLHPANRLRRKLVVLTAILETDPAHVDRFEPVRTGVVALLARSGVVLLAVCCKTLIGLPLYVAATWRR